MARKPRIHISGSTYHCMLRGNNGKNIFQHEKDFYKLSLLLQEGTERFGHRILGFCFMSNHIHLVIQVTSTPLSKIIQNFAFRYTRYINKNYKQIGHLFQGRFKSILVSGSEYLLELVRYVHLNPVRAGIVKKPEEYFWNGHQTYIGNDTFLWVSPSKVLQRLHKDSNKAQKKYYTYIHNGIGKECSIDFKFGNQKGLDVLGDDAFTEQLIYSYSLEHSPTYTTSNLLETSLNHFKTELPVLSSKSRNRKNSRIRAILSYLTRETKGCSLTELASCLNRDLSTLSKSANKIEHLMTQNTEIKEDLQTIKAKLLPCT